jgi:hypothetical protein
MTRWLVCLAALCVSAAGVFALTAGANHSQTELISTGPNGGNGPKEAEWGGVSSDGTHVYFTTSESLVSADTDSAIDVYERVGATTTLVSIGPTGGNGAIEARFSGVSADGSRVFVETAEQLTSTDTDSGWDVYERSGGTTTQVSTGPGGGNSGIESFYGGISVDGSRVFFTSYDALVAGDTDSGRKDVYERSGGTTTLISTGPTGGSGAYGADFSRVTPDGAIVFFRTQEPLVSGDTDTSLDIYKRAGGTTTHLSVGHINGNGAFDAIFRGMSLDGSRVFFDTSEQLTSGDTDANRDSYERTGTTTTKLSLGAGGGNGPWDSNIVGLNADGSKIWFQTQESMAAADTDGACPDELGNPVEPCLDVYERSGITSSLVSTGGNGSHDASFAAASHDGSRVFFHTTESLVASDTDSPMQDVYERSGGTTTLISAPGNGPHYATISGISTDGARVFFQTYEQLVGADTDVWNDVYERYGGQTTLISTGPASTSGSNIAFYDGNSDNGTRVFFHTDESLTSGDTDGRIDIYANNQAVSPGYARPKGASPATFALVPAYQECTTPNNVHGAPLAHGSCGPPTQESGALTVGTPDANLKPAGSISSVKLRAIVGASGPPDDSNVQVSITVRDALCRATNAACGGGPLSDYTGQVLVSFGLRLTDRYNGSPLVEAATVQSLDIQVPVQCVATAATGEGGLCQTTATVNSLYPGAVLDGRRAVWEVRDIEVLDAGPNGTGYGAGCPPTCGDGDEAVFMRPGLFAP